MSQRAPTLARDVGALASRASASKHAGTARAKPNASGSSMPARAVGGASPRRCARARTPAPHPRAAKTRGIDQRLQLRIDVAAAAQWARRCPTRARARAAPRPRRSAPRTAASRCTRGARDRRSSSAREPAAAQQPVGERFPRARVDDRRLGRSLGHAHDVRRDRALIGRRDHERSMRRRPRGSSMRTNRRCTRASCLRRDEAVVPWSSRRHRADAGASGRRACRSAARRARDGPPRARAGMARGRDRGAVRPTLGS